MLDFLLIALAMLATGIPLAVQGFAVMQERNGYRKNPKMKGVRKGDRVLVVRFLTEPCVEGGKSKR